MSKTPTRWPNGLNNQTPESLFGNLPVPYRFDSFTEYGTDFDRYRSADWTETITTGGSVAQSNAANGEILLTTAAGAGDTVYIDKTGESFAITAGDRAWFDIRFKTDDATLTNIVAGLQVTDTTPMAVSDGIYFLKAAGAATVNLVSASGGTATVLATDLFTLTANAFYKFRFAFDGASTVKYQVQDSTGVAVAGGSATIATLPTGTQTMSFGIDNGTTAAAKTMTVDYIFAGQDTTR